MDLSTTKGKLVAVGVAVGASVAGLYAYSLLSRKGNKKKGGAGKRKKKVKGALTKEETLVVFEQLIKIIGHVLQRISAQEMTIRKNYQKAGQPINMDQMYKFLQQRLEEEMAQAEPVVYNKYNTTEAAVKAAVKKYKDDSDVKELVSRFQTLASQVKKPEAKVPEDMTEEKFIALMTEMMGKITELMETIVGSVKAANPEITDLAQSPQFNVAMMTQFQPGVQTISTEVMKKHGVEDEAVFTAVLQSYQKSSTFNTSLQKLTDEQAKKFEELGVASMS